MQEVVRIQAAITARYEAELSLKATMAALSRVQQDHYAEQHPYKPFPTAELEAAVAAVPVSKHPWRERRLLRFGRDLLFRWARARAGGGSLLEGRTLAKPDPLLGVSLGRAAGSERPRTASPGERRRLLLPPHLASLQPGYPPRNSNPLPLCRSATLCRRGDAAESASNSTPAAAAAADVGSSSSMAAAAEPALEAPTPKAAMSEQWLRECAAFASTYYRFVDRSLFHNPRAQGILRETLPMHREPLRYAVGGGRGGRAGSMRHSSSGSRYGGGSGNGSGGGGGGFRSGGSGGKPKPAVPSPGKAQPYSSTASMAALQAGVARFSSKAGGLPSASPPLAALHLRLRPQYSSAVSPAGVQQLLRQCSRMFLGAGTRRLLSCFR